VGVPTLAAAAAAASALNRFASFAISCSSGDADTGHGRLPGVGRSISSERTECSELTICILFRICGKLGLDLGLDHSDCIQAFEHCLLPILCRPPWTFNEEFALTLSLWPFLQCLEQFRQDAILDVRNCSGIFRLQDDPAKCNVSPAHFF
jgi:hypothetical protein